ncbi:diadenylate cyclase CdaA [Granulicatella seriolae]|uniref:Diadenylate cyclase n=1 Tax=Granulicatella seriolae TaxID=2967226 RepID=A0ABT1WNV9_9LACT|nr:diadenylate cyclase CdaA [Granulicatella seriolae]
MNFNLDSFWSWSTLTNLIDILVVWFLLYKLLVIIKGTRAIQLMKGLGVIAAVKFLSYYLNLHTLDWIMNLVIQWGVVASIIVFQPEIRRGLEHIGRTTLFGRRYRTENRSERMIDELNIAVQYMAKRRIGALISIEQNTNLQEYIQTGIPMQADISNQLMINIFIPNTPLHDGAVIIRDYKIAAAGCYLPLSESMVIPKELGTRHRAAIGLSEVSDAITIIISEETGKVSITIKERLLRELSPEAFVQTLRDNLYDMEDKEKEQTPIQGIIDFFKGGRSQ